MSLRPRSRIAAAAPRRAGLAVAVALLVGAAARPALAIRPKADATPGAASFVEDARLLMRVVACSGDAEIPPDWAKVVEAHCVEHARRTEAFHKKYVDRATPFFQGLRPSGLPTTVVYPFGGGDLVSALITYPEATEITTISLEHAGDPTRLRSLTPGQLKKSLGLFRAAIRGLLINNDSASVNMMKMERGSIPGQLSFHLTGAAIMGYRVDEMRFFRIEPDGALHYYTAAEIAGLAQTTAKKKKGDWVDTDFSVAFTNVELQLVKEGAQPLTYRHIAANLANSAFAGSGLQKHLEQKGEIAAMTKAASYLLWNEGFSAIRDFLATHAVWMASDSTGIPPRHARKAGLVQTTYGRFTGPFLGASEVIAEAFRGLWKSQPYRKLPFRYGYPDAAGNVHMMITTRKPAPAPPSGTADSK
jgi:hypothetical protein